MLIKNSMLRSLIKRRLISEGSEEISDEDIESFCNEITELAKNIEFVEIAEEYSQKLTDIYIAKMKTGEGVSPQFLKSNPAVKHEIISFAKILATKFVSLSRDSEVAMKIYDALTKELISMLIGAFSGILDETACGFTYDRNMSPFNYYFNNEEILPNDEEDEYMFMDNIMTPDLVVRIDDFSKVRFASAVLFDTFMKQFGWWFSYIAEEATRCGATMAKISKWSNHSYDIWENYKQYSKDYSG